MDVKTVFDQACREELAGRIRLLNGHSLAQWGKMNVYQMLKHCTIWDEWVQGTNTPIYRQEFLGRIFGRLALKTAVNPGKPIQKNMPAGRDFIVKEKEGDIEHQKQARIERLNAYAEFSNPAFVHDFFGKMTSEQIGIFAYKHADHHLRQFNA